jgi:hypothetical protein
MCRDSKERHCPLRLAVDLSPRSGSCQRRRHPSAAGDGASAAAVFVRCVSVCVWLEWAREWISLSPSCMFVFVCCVCFARMGSGVDLSLSLMHVCVCALCACVCFARMGSAVDLSHNLKPRSVCVSVGSTAERSGCVGLV